MARTEDEFLRKHHKQDVRENQCSSYLVKRIKAPVDLVWYLVRRFDQPQNYNPFVIDCHVQGGDLKIGSVRQVNFRSELPATSSTERLEILDDEERVFSVRTIDGDRRRRNYTSIVTVHPETVGGRLGTLVVESYVVDVADGKTKEETCSFFEGLIKSNLESLADLSEDEFLRKHHKHDVRENQCSSYLVKRIKAPVDLVWSLVRRFDQRTERVEILDDEERVFSVRTIDGDRGRRNYTSIVTVHPETVGGRLGTLVVASYVVDVADGRTKEETCFFFEGLIKFDLELLADLSESLAVTHPSHESNSKSKAIEEAIEDKLKSIEQDNVPMEVESELDSSNQEASSLTVDWTAPEVNLTNSRCSELPENPTCSFLVNLYLQHNTYLTEIPASFFEDMPVLRVLDMSNTSIKTLPSSISKLFRLRELFLRGCEMLMELPSEIESLTNLKVLDLEGTELVCLPKQVGWLLQLECLKFSLYRYADRHKQSINGIERSIISEETLSKLSSLKELSIDVDPECEWWDEEVDAVISDLGELGNLETLKLYLPTLELFQQLLHRRCIKRLEWDVVMPLLYPTLSNFQFVVGRHKDPIMSCVPRDLQEEFLKLEKCLKYVNGEEDLDARVLEHVGALFLHRHWNIDTLSHFNVVWMDKLKFCLIAECDKMESILNGYHFNYSVKNSGMEPILGSLCYLGIHYMKNLRSISEGQIPKGSLSSLKILAIHTCPNLTTIFHLKLLPNLIFLQELIVEDCPEVQSLVTQGCFLSDQVFLPRLEKISLLRLPELKNISHGQWIAPRLEKMVIFNCPMLKNLHPLEKCSIYVKEIKGESKWWKSNKSGWSSEQHDYLVRVFVPLKGDDDDSIDELAEAVRISLTSQVTERNEDLIINMDMEMEGKLEEHPKEAGTSKSTSERNEGLIVNMNMEMEDTLEECPIEIVGTSKSTSDELVPIELSNWEFSTSNLKNTSVNKFYWGLVAEPRKNPEFSFVSSARTLGVASLSGCNLSDDSFPRDLSCLYYLWELDLSSTPISTLHKGIKWPNTLKFLKLNGCRNLRFLPELPLLQVLAVNECRALERVNFGSNKLNSAPVSLLSHGCDRLVEVDSVFRLEPIENFHAEITNSWGLDNLKSLGNVEVELCNNMTLTRKKLPLQGLFEFGVLSTFLPKSKIPSFFSNMQPCSSITFAVPSTTPNLSLLRGMNLCVVYERSKEHKHEQYYGLHINMCNGSRLLDWNYYPTVYGDGEDRMMWLSYWGMSDYQMGAGDLITVSVDVDSGFEVKECGTCLVYGEAKEIISPVTISQSVVIKHHPYVSSPLASRSNVHSQRGHHLFLDPLK